MKKLVITLLALMPFVAKAQELTEVMRIEMQDTTIILKVADIKSFSFDMIELEDVPTEPNPEPDYELRYLTFEDDDAKFDSYTLDYAGADITTWSDLIADPQYDDGSGNHILYSWFATEGDEYRWYDEGNTYLAHSLPGYMGMYMYWNGGEAISSYASRDVVENGYYPSQLTVYGDEDAGGYDGSKNFCMHFGYYDEEAKYNLCDKLSSLSFGDGVPRVIDHMYVNSSTYALNCYWNGNDLTNYETIGDDDFVKLIAIGYDENEEETARVEFLLVDGKDNITTEWKKWDLSGLGKVLRVELNMSCSNQNKDGDSMPAYFAYDNIAVRFEKK